MTEIPEVDLHAKNPREQEPTDFKHIVLLFDRGEEQINGATLEKIVTERFGENDKNVIIHHLSGGVYKDGGIYPCMVDSCFRFIDKNTTKEYRPKKWYVETPSDNHTTEDLHKTARLWQESTDVSERDSLFCGLVEQIHPKPQDWDAAEKETIQQMNFILLRYNQQIEIWMSPKRLARLQIS